MSDYRRIEIDAFDINYDGNSLAIIAGKAMDEEDKIARAEILLHIPREVAFKLWEAIGKELAVIE